MRIIRAIINILTSSKGRKGRQRVLASLMAVVVFCTTYTLILPAITLDRQTAESEPGIEAETAAEETLGEVQDADLLLAGQNAEEDETVAVETETEEIVNTSAETEEVVSDPETEERREKHRVRMMRCFFTQKEQTADTRSAHIAAMI